VWDDEEGAFMYRNAVKVRIASSGRGTVIAAVEH
jgi:hypothetical protein